MFSRRPWKARFTAITPLGQAPDATLLNIHGMPAPRFREIFIFQLVNEFATAVQHETAMACLGWNAMLLLGIHRSRVAVPFVLVYPVAGLFTTFQPCRE
jgi:hypothetical protein